MTIPTEGLTAENPAARRASVERAPPPAAFDLGFAFDSAFASFVSS